MKAHLLTFSPAAVLTLAALAPAQQFTEPHRMLPRFLDGNNFSFSGAVFADFDSDGDQDAFLTASSGYPPTNRILFNEGDGTFRDFTSLVTGPLGGYSTCAAVADLDHDGDLDIYVGNTSGEDEIWWNVSPGRFDIEPMGSFTDGRTSDVAIGDLNGDTFVDIFLTIGGDSYGWGSPDLVVLNDGLGNFTTQGTVPGFNQTSNAVALGDVDGDGDLDALVGNGSGAAHLVPHLFINQGGAMFTDETLQIPGIFGEFQDVSLVDVDADGDLDAILANEGFHDDQLYLNQGNGTFVSTTGQLPGTESSVVTILDSDGDGDPDVLLDGTLAENDGNGFFTISAQTMPHLLVIEDTAAADIDGDGDQDLLVANDWETTQMLLNDGNGSFLDVSGEWPKASRFSEAVDAGDVDGDGDIDLFFGREWGANELLLNDGTGEFEFSPNALPHGHERTRSVDFADFDGDGDLDLFFTNGSFSGGYPAEPDRLYLNNGNGVFLDATAQLPNVVEHSREADLGDIDGDGDIDILVAVYDGPERLYLNDGSANFSDHSANFPSPTATSLDAHLVDIDQDGDLDAYIAHSQHDRLYVNQGGAVFVEESFRMPTLFATTFSVASADVNQDGFQDIVTGRYNVNDKAYFVLMNDGSGNFLDRTSRIPPSDALDGLALEFADTDGDGDQDLYIAASGVDVLMKNDGSGFFTDASADLKSHWDISEDVVAADLDGDEDLDFAVAQGRVNQIYTNTLRQLSWLSLPRADRTLRLLVQGEANSSYTLVGSAIPSYQVLPAYGTLRLSYADRFIQVSGTLDGSGKAIWESPIVLPSSMAGATLYWQALIGSTPRLSNLEATEISLW